MAQTTVVPAGAYVAEVRVVGGHCGEDCRSSDCPPGGDGAQITGWFAVFGGEVLTANVAGRGGNNNGNASPGDGGWGSAGGGRGGSASGTGSDGAGGGATSLTCAGS
jgi:hypothetical protein